MLVRQGLRRLAALAGGGARLGYLGAPRDAVNLGDAVMHHAAERLLAPHRLIDVSHPSAERRLERLRLAGRPFLRAGVVGGGTLFNPASLPVVRTLLEQGLRLASIGTGAGAWGYGMPHEVELGDWPALLARFARVGVRGPRSKAALERAGFGGAEVVGDLALLETRPGPAPIEAAKRVAVNVLAPEDGRPAEQDPLCRGTARFLERLRRDGWIVVPIALHPLDVAPVEAVLALAGAPGRAHRPRTLDDFLQLVAPCRMMIAFRLHAAVLSTCLGVAPLSVEYRPKCRDFMESMDLGAHCLDVRDVGVDALEERALALAAIAADLRPSVHARALGWKQTLERFTAETLRALSH